VSGIIGFQNSWSTEGTEYNNITFCNKNTIQKYNTHGSLSLRWMDDNTVVVSLVR